MDFDKAGFAKPAEPGRSHYATASKTTPPQHVISEFSEICCCSYTIERGFVISTVGKAVVDRGQIVAPLYF